MKEKSFGRSIKSTDVLRNFKKSHSSYEINRAMVFGIGAVSVLLVIYFLSMLLQWNSSPIAPIENSDGGFPDEGMYKDSSSPIATIENSDNSQLQVIQSKVKREGNSLIGNKIITSTFQYKFFNSRRFGATGNRYSMFEIEYNSELANCIELLSSKGQSISAFKKYMRKKPVSLPMVFPSDEDFFAITGAMYDTDNLPPGLVVSGGLKLKDLNTFSGKGNFYEPKPNGVFYVDDLEAGIMPTTDYQKVNPSFAIQSGPMLVNNGVVNSDIRDINSLKYNRSAVGIRKSGQSGTTLVFVSSVDKISMAELAKYMKMELGCSDALHLESINAFIHFPGSTFPAQSQNIRNYIVIK